MLDLHDDMATWNRKHHTNFVSLPEFCQYLYNQYGSVSRVGEALFISPSAIHVRFKAIGVQFLKKGVRFPSKKLGILLKLETENMTLREIVGATGYAFIYCQKQLKKYRLSYKKVIKKGLYNRVDYKGEPILPFVFGKGWKEGGHNVK